MTLALLPQPGAREGRDRLEILTALVSAPSFDPLFRGDIITIPAGHPVYRWDCLADGCERVISGRGDLCRAHEGLFKSQFRILQLVLGDLNVQPGAVNPEIFQQRLGQVNVRGTFSCSQTCIPHLLKSSNPHILNISPPLNFEPRWFAPHVAYTMAKYGMSLCVLGMAEEFRTQGLAVNALWPRSIIATAAVLNLLGGEQAVNRSRTPEIMADAAHAILTRPSGECTGNFFIDDEVLRAEGVTDLKQYSKSSEAELIPDLFV